MRKNLVFNERYLIDGKETKRYEKIVFIKIEIENFRTFDIEIPFANTTTKRFIGATPMNEEQWEEIVEKKESSNEMYSYRDYNSRTHSCPFLTATESGLSLLSSLGLLNTANYLVVKLS